MLDLEKLFILQITLIPGLLLYAINDVKKLRREFEAMKNEITAKLVTLETWRQEHTDRCTERHAQHLKSIDELWDQVSTTRTAMRRLPRDEDAK